MMSILVKRKSQLHDIFVSSPIAVHAKRRKTPTTKLKISVLIWP